MVWYDVNAWYDIPHGMTNSAGAYSDNVLHLIFGGAGLSLEDAASDACATLPVAVTKARSSVRMRFLIGAAPVCYGLPVSCSSVT
jgi:hypothetical protein